MFSRRFDWLQSNMRFAVLCVFALLCVSAVAQVGAKPFSAPLPRSIPEPRDQLFRGTIQLHVDATDTIHSLFRVTETIPLQTSGEMVLLYPEWETTSHGPTVSVIELAGLRMQVDGHDIEWRRDTIDVHAFHLTVPCGSVFLGVGFPIPAVALLGQVASRDGRCRVATSPALPGRLVCPGYSGGCAARTSERAACVHRTHTVAHSYYFDQSSGICT